MLFFGKCLLFGLPYDLVLVLGVPWCKPPVSPFAGLNNQRKPVLKRHGDGDTVDA